MQYAPEEYTKHYIVQALFKLMSEYEFEKISVTDIAEKAGVGRATFYRYFKRKEDIILFYFEHHAKEFAFSQRIYPRCKEDYVSVAESVFKMFKENKEPFKLIRKAHLEHIYLDYLNKSFALNFENNLPEENFYKPYLYAGMIFNVSMIWLDHDCKEPAHTLADMIVDAIYFK